MLVLDAGSSLTGSWVSLRSNGKVMVEAMNLMGYDALALGRMEFAVGLEALRERQAEATFAMLSANIVALENQEPLFPAYTVVEKDGVKFGIIGLSEAEAIDGPGVRDVAAWLDPMGIIADLVQEVKAQADVVVVLSHLGIDRDHQLAQAAPDINIIVGGLTRQLMEQPEREGNTLIVQQGYRGEWLGKLVVTLDADRVPQDYTEELLTLDDKYADDEAVLDVLSGYNQLYPSPTPMPTKTPIPEN